MNGLGLTLVALAVLMVIANYRHEGRWSDNRVTTDEVTLSEGTD